MTPEQLADLERQYTRATRWHEETDGPLPLRIAENTLRYAVNFDAPMPANAADLVLSALSRLHQVERAARSTIGAAERGDQRATAIGIALIRDALRANLGNGSNLDNEDRR